MTINVEQLIAYHKGLSLIGNRKKGSFHILQNFLYLVMPDLRQMRAWFKLCMDIIAWIMRRMYFLAQQLAHRLHRVVVIDHGHFLVTPLPNDLIQPVLTLRRRRAPGGGEQLTE